MTSNQPHPQRCETCRWRKPPLMDQCAAYREHSIDCFEAYFDDFTSIVGCASHSSATEPEPNELPSDYWNCPFREGCKEGESWCEWPCDKWAVWHDAAIAQAARKDEREKVLDEVLGALDLSPFYEGHRWKYQEVIESLRGGGAP